MSLEDIIVACLKKLHRMKWIQINENVREEAIAEVILGEIKDAPLRAIMSFIRRIG